MRSRRSRAGDTTTAAIHPGNATGDSTATARSNPTPWGAQTEVKKLTEDRFGVNAAIGWRAGDNFELNVDALYSKFTIDEDQNQAWYGRNGISGNWANGRRGATTIRSLRLHRRARQRGRGDARQLLRPVTNVIAKYTEDKDLLVTGVNGKFEFRILDHDRRSLVLQCRAHQSLGGVPCPRSSPATMTYDMSAGIRPSVTTSSDPSDPTIQAAPDWLPGQSDGPDDLKDELSAVRFDVTRDFEGDREVVAVRRCACPSARRTSSAASMTSSASSPATLPADLFTSYTVKEFDAPPLLNGDFDEIIDYVYGGMPATDTVVQSSIWNVEESV